MKFSTTENLLHLCAAETIYCDGTFYTAPPMFDQLFTIHAFVGDVMFPLVFSLLPKRDTATYNIFFTLLKDIASRHSLNFSPRRVTLYFECASRNAATDTFSSADLLRFLFHYAKTIWRKTPYGGLQTAYKDVPDVTKLVRRAACLPLLPRIKVEDFWFSHWKSKTKR